MSRVFVLGCFRHHVIGFLWASLSEGGVQVSPGGWLKVSSLHKNSDWIMMSADSIICVYKLLSFLLRSEFHSFCRTKSSLFFCWHIKSSNRQNLTQELVINTTQWEKDQDPLHQHIQLTALSSFRTILAFALSRLLKKPNQQFPSLRFLTIQPSREE